MTKLLKLLCNLQNRNSSKELTTKKIAVRETHVGRGWEDKGLINEQTEPYKTT